MPGSVIVAGARTPICREHGGLSALPAPALGAAAIREAVRRAGVDGGEVDSVVFGQAVQAGAGPNPARLAAARAGLPLGVPAVTVNKLGLSGLEAIVWADLLVTAGGRDIVVAGGMESASCAPVVGAPGVRESGGRQDADDDVSGLVCDALRCGFDGVTASQMLEGRHRAFGVSCDDALAFAVGSHRRAADAWKSGRLHAEIAPVSVPGLAPIAHDDGIQPGLSEQMLLAGGRTSSRVLPQLAAASADGASAIVVMSRRLAERRGVPWLAEIRAAGESAGPDATPFGRPSAALREALRRERRCSARRLDLIEIDESHPLLAVETLRTLGVDGSQVNVNGGAIALGDPVGMTGARAAFGLAMELHRRGGGIGGVALAGGGGQGGALLLRA
ncbi:MAG: acetyl-CoA C-acyltransferase [Streptomycetaceae bacterium]|nr:acetyl-CoA C-acyltransferase [Streptomycetaceae bacterium]